MKRKSYRLILIISLIFLSQTILSFAENIISPASKNQIRLGSFNIEKLGKENEYQARNAAKILENHDIVAVQEVMNTGAGKTNPHGEKGIEALKQIVSYLGEDWNYVVSTEANGTASAEKSKAYNTFEYYAYLYRKSKLELVEDSAYLWDEQGNPIANLKNQERQFDREPFIASFKTKQGNLDFTLIAIHAASPAQKWRKDEIARLEFVYKTVQDSDVSQNDVFLLGDFNTNVDKREWDALKNLPSMKHIITAREVTTLDKARGRLSKNQYDTIWYQGQYSDEDIILESAEVYQAWKEDLERPEVNIPKKIKNQENKQIWLYGKYASDHLPITVLLWTDRDTDNFQATVNLEDSKEALIYNEEALTEQLKGKTGEEVVKVLGEPAVKKPSEESEKYLGYWWYDLPEAGIFVYFKDGKVYNISILTEDKRSKEL